MDEETRSEELEKFRDLLAQRRRRRKESPLEFYVPLPHQARFHASGARERAFISGNRAGKTEANVVQCLRRALGMDPHRADFPVPNTGWVTSLSAEAQRDILQPKFEKYLPAGRVVKIRKRQNDCWDQIVFDNESVIGFKSCEMDPKVLQGSMLHWASFDEEPEQAHYDEVKMRLADQAGDLWASLTPLAGMTWSYDRWVDPETRVSDVEVFGASMWDNAVSRGGYIPDAEIARLEADIRDPIMRRIRIYGEYKSQVGRIYKDFDRAVHGVAELLREFRNEDGSLASKYDTYCSIDTGRSFAVGFYLVDYFGNVWRFDEYYAEDKTIAEHATQVLAVARQYGIAPDYLIDPSSQFVRDLAEHGIVASPADHEVMKGIETVWDYMAYNPAKPRGSKYGNPRFYVVTGGGRNKRFLWEIQRYQWAAIARTGNLAGVPKNEPRKKDDHCMDEMRYLLVSQPEPSRPGPGEEDDRPIERRIREHVVERLNSSAGKRTDDAWGMLDY